MLRVEYEYASALDGIQKLLARLENPAPALNEIGENMANSTMERFSTGTAPDGSPWAENSPVTVAIYGGLFASVGRKKPLVGESRRLSGEISYQVDRNAVEIGSAMPYADMQQWGGKKAQWPHLWGDIPARPYLGISDADEANILDIIKSYLMDG